MALGHPQLIERRDELEAEAAGALGGAGEDLPEAGQLAAAHQHLTADDHRVDDGAACGVDEVGGELADPELGGA